MARRSEAEEIIGAIISIFVLLFIIYIFYTTNSPIQSIFQGFINEVIIGIIIILILGIIVFFYLHSKD